MVPDEYINEYVQINYILFVNVIVPRSLLLKTNI